MTTEEFDDVIVGAGAAGSVLAIPFPLSRLRERAGVRAPATGTNP